MSPRNTTTSPISHGISNPPSIKTTDQASNGKENAGVGATSPILSYVKEVRAFEHDRQRVRKATDFVKKRMQKAQPWGAKPLTPKKGLASAAPSENIMAFRDEARDLDIPAALPRKYEIEDEYDVPSLSSRREVRLTDLVVARKSRKTKDGDFEIVPHLRSVIVLDDNASYEMSLEEPWEHIEGADVDNPDSEPSYAKVASLAN